MKQHDNWLIEHRYQMNTTQNKIIEWMRDANNVPEWWTDLLQGKQMVSEQT